MIWRVRSTFLSWANSSPGIQLSSTPPVLPRQFCPDMIDHAINRRKCVPRIEVFFLGQEYGLVTLVPGQKFPT